MALHFWPPVRAVGSVTVAATAFVLAVMTIGTLGPRTSPLSVHRHSTLASDLRASRDLRSLPFISRPSLIIGRPHPVVSPPPLVVVLGDSTAATIGFALRETEPPETTVMDRANFGCGLATGTWASNIPPTPQMPMFPACNQAEPASQQWPSLEATSVGYTAPGDVVLFIAGSWECEDILHDGRWSNITQPSFQQYLLSQMRLAVRIGTAHGAHFAFTTMPAIDNGTVGDAPIRRLIYNHLLDIVAEQFPSSVSLIDLDDILSPGGVFTEYLDGVQVRTPDGIHTPAYEPGNVFVNNSSEAVADAFYHWLSPRLWPMIIATDRPADGHPVQAQ